MHPTNGKAQSLWYSLVENHWVFSLYQCLSTKKHINPKKTGGEVSQFDPHPVFSKNVLLWERVKFWFFCEFWCYHKSHLFEKFHWYFTTFSEDMKIFFFDINCFHQLFGFADSCLLQRNWWRQHKQMISEKEKWIKT